MLDATPDKVLLIVSVLVVVTLVVLFAWLARSGLKQGEEAGMDTRAQPWWFGGGGDGGGW